MAESYFHSKHSAQGMEDVFDGAVVFNAGQSLSTSQKAQARANIGAGAENTGFRILGYYLTLQELRDSLQTPPQAGDAYGIAVFHLTTDASPEPGMTYYTRGGSGTAEDPYVYTLFSGATFDPGVDYYTIAYYDTYVYDGASQDWLDIGPINEGDFIDDSEVSPIRTWSSEKINEEITDAVSASATASGISVYTHSKSGTVHSLTLAGGGNNIKFIATAAFTKGDTVEVNGNAVTVLLPNGKAPGNNFFVYGAVVLAFLSGSTLFLVGGGSGAEIKLTVTANDGDTVTVAKGATTLSETLDGVTSFTFELPELGTWTVTNTTNNLTRTIEAQYYGNYEVNLAGYIFGIKRVANGPSPAWQRTDDSANFTATASVGDVAGSSDFDNMPIYSEIQRVTVATGDVMVKIPKFYYQRFVDDDGYENIRISDAQFDGFILHPAFQHNGLEQNYIYIGAHKTSAGHVSKSGFAPLVSTTRAAFRVGAAAKGNGWSQIDVFAYSAIALLILVEFANNNVQEVIGAGWSNGSSAKATGGCDSVPNLTGRPAGTSNAVQVVWRGIEDFWGNVWELVDGLNWNNGTYYVCKDQTQFADDTATGYTPLEYIGAATNWNKTFIAALGFDSNNLAVFLPQTASGGSDSTYWCDAVWSATGWRVSIRGGSYDNGTAVGLFAWTFSNTSSVSSANSGSRLLYVPS